MARVVRSSFPNRLQMLETFLRQGGIPAGLVTIEENTDGKREYCYGVFEDDVIADWAEPYMAEFVVRMAESEAIGIDDFRIRH